MLRSAHTMSGEGQLTCLSELKAFSTIELAFEKYPELPNSESEVDPAAQYFNAWRHLHSAIWLARQDLIVRIVGSFPDLLLVCLPWKN